MGQVDAVLLIGPTGSGKTPLGEAIQRAGICGRKVYHFDFGEHLRKAAAARKPIYGLSEKETQLIRRLLVENKLLPGKSLGIARKIITGYMSSSLKSTVNRQPGMILLNGYPRNIRQAAMIARIIRISLVIEISASPAVVLARIARDTGGDRKGRSDDSNSEILRKLQIYRSETLPILEFYRQRKVLILKVNAGISSTALQMLGDIKRKVNICP